MIVMTWATPTICLGQKTQKSEKVRAAPDELDQPSPAASLPSPSASSGKTIEVSSSPSISLPSSILVRRSAIIANGPIPIDRFVSYKSFSPEHKCFLASVSSVHEP